MLVRRLLAALTWIGSAPATRSLVLVLAGGLGGAAWLCKGAFVGEWWIGTVVGAFAAWFLAGVVLARSDEDVPVLLAQLARCVAPLALALASVLVSALSLPPMLAIICEATALGGLAGMLAYLWLVPTSRPLVRLKGWIRSLWPLVLVLVVWVMTYSVTNVGAWWNLKPSVGDQAVYEQAIYNTLHGRFLSYSGDLHYPYPVCRFADHFEPILLVFVPLWALCPTPLWLLLGQIGLLASGAIPVARLARRWYALPAAGFPFALAYLLHPGLHSALNSEFHLEVLAAPLLLWGLAFGLERRFVASSLALLAALSCKENIPAVVCLVGLFLAYKGERRYGLAVALVAVAWGVLALKVIIPHFSPLGYSPYANVLDDPRRHLFLTGQDPSGAYLRARLTYVLEVTGPVLGLCFLAPAALALSASEFALHLLSSSRLMSMVAAHYHVTITVGVMVGGIAGLTWLSRRWAQRFAPGDEQQQARVRRSVLIGFAVGSLWVLLQGSNILAHFPLADFHWPSPLVQRQHRLLAQVPDEVPVLLNAGALASPLSRRPRFVNRARPGAADEEMLQDCRQFDYVALQTSLTDDQAALIAKRHGLRLMGHEGDIWLWQVVKGASPAPSVSTPASAPTEETTRVRSSAPSSAVGPAVPTP